MSLFSNYLLCLVASVLPRAVFAVTVCEVNNDD